MPAYYDAKIVFMYDRALKLHFTTEEYDFVKYKGKIHVNEISQFQLKMYSKLANMIVKQEIVPFLVSQYIGRIKTFNIGDIYENPVKAQKIYEKWLDRITDLSSLYQKDLETIAKISDGSWMNALRGDTKSDYPLVFKMVVKREISPESYSFLNDVFLQTKPRDTVLGNDLIYVMMNRKYRKYRSFLNMSVDKVVDMTPGDLSTLNRM